MHSRHIARAVALMAAVALVAGLLGACDSDGTPGQTSQRPPTAPSAVDEAGPTASQLLGLAEGWGPDRTELDRAARAARRLRLPELAGQVIVADYRGTTAPVGMVKRLHLGGVIAFSGNVASADQVRRVNRGLARGVPRRWPLFLGVDQEGGLVERLRGAATRFPAFMSAGAAGNPALTQEAYAAYAAELGSLGFTVDFAPDADVTAGPGDPTIGSRSASSRPAVVAEQVVAAASGFQAGGVLPVIKHFPGHGSVGADSHQTLPIQTRSLAQVRSRDLVPFQVAVEAGLPAVMVGHLDLRALDPGVPTSLSRKAITGLLRNSLGFEGLVVTDSLQMAGVTRGRDTGQIAVQAMRAGADVLLMPASAALARAALVRAVRRGDLPRRRLEQAAARQIALLRHLAQADTPARGPARAASRALSAGAITVTDGPCGGPLTGVAVHAYGDPAAVGAFAVAARAAGVTVLIRQAPPARLAQARPKPDRRKRESRRSFLKRKKAWKRAEKRRERRLRAWTAQEDARVGAGTQVGFVGYHGAPLAGDIVVATDTPWVLGRVTAPTRIATYADTPAAMEVLVDVLTGKTTAPGHLPVTVRGVARDGC